MSDYKDKVQQRIEDLRRRRRKDFRDRAVSVVGTSFAIGLVALLLAFIIVVSGLITLFAWNVGIVAIIGSLGGTVAKISLIEAIGVNVALGIIARAVEKTQQQLS